MIIKGINYVENNHELAMNLRIARKNIGLTQQNVGDLVNLGRSNLAYYESGRATVSIFTLIRLSKIYNLQPVELLIKKHKISY